MRSCLGDSAEEHCSHPTHQCHHQTATDLGSQEFYNARVLASGCKPGRGRPGG